MCLMMDFIEGNFLVGLGVLFVFWVLNVWIWLFLEFLLGEVILGVFLKDLGFFLF